MDEFVDTTLGELTVSLDNARRPIKSSERVPGGTPYYGASGIVDWVDGFTHEGEHLLVSEDGENLRSRSTPIAFVVSGQIWANNHVHVLRGREPHDTRYLKYALAATDLTGFLTGSAQPKLSKSSMDSIPMRVPPSRERRATTEVLGALDDKFAANLRAADTAEELAGHLFAHEKSAFENFTVTLGTLASTGALDLGDGYRTRGSEYGRPGLRILRAGDVAHGTADATGPDFVSEEFVHRIGSKSSRAHDIVLTTKGTVGRVAVIPPDLERVVYSPQVCFFRVTDADQLDRGFLAAWFRSGDLKQQAAARMYESDMAPYINLQDVRSLEIPVVSLSEQRRIGASQSALTAFVHRAQAENRTLAKTRDTLLPLLMSGRMRVDRAEREVADLL